MTSLEPVPGFLFLGAELLVSCLQLLLLQFPGRKLAVLSALAAPGNSTETGIGEVFRQK